MLNNICIKMADVWIPIHIRGSGRGNPAMGNKGGQGGRHAPTVASRGHPVGGSPIATRLSIQQGISSTDGNLDIFLTVKLNTTSQFIAVGLAHVKKIEVASKPRVLAPRPWHQDQEHYITSFTADVSLEHRR
jgi:hypothetical protein